MSLLSQAMAYWVNGLRIPMDLAAAPLGVEIKIPKTPRQVWA